MRNSEETVSEITDRDLLRRYVDADDQQAFALLLSRYEPLVKGRCRRSLWGDHAAAEEATQTVFVILSRKAATLSTQRSLSGWLYRVTGYVCANMRRARARRGRHLSDYRQEATPQPCTVQEEDVRGHEALLLMDDLVDELPAQLRDVVRRHYFEGVPFKQIAEETHCTDGTIRMRAQRARKRLKKKLEKRGVVFSIAALAALLKREGAASTECSVFRTQCSVGEALEGVGELADSVLRRMWWQGGMKAAGIAASGLVLVGGMGAVLRLTNAGPRVSDPHGAAVRAEETLAPASAAVNLPGPAHHWPFDGDACDRVGTLDGVLRNGATAAGEGIDGQCLDLDGIDDYCEIRDAQTEQGLGRYAVALWFKAEDINGDQHLYDEGDRTNGLAIRLNRARLEAAVCKHGTVKTAGREDIVAGKWHFVVVLYIQEGILWLLLDGGDSPVQVRHGLGNLPKHGSGAAIGCKASGSAFGSGNGANFRGLIDDVRRYQQRGLTFRHVQYLYDHWVGPRKAL